ncbi:shikimate kinase [Gaetbulibacter aquiaggeris]|uniref:Shikimate kinase n=1 Tax=Gaetbulibacter aquiaggeris TaxID=1735373 RepID=A0ABW7MNW1_9FLAO
MIVVLIGYMASGKSSLGKVLAKRLNYNFIDLDDFIETKEKMPVKNIFDTKGEIYFRKVENLYLKELIYHVNDTVLSLGGGTPCYGNNMRTLLDTDDVKSIYLKASIPSLINRLKNEKIKRPLISHIKTNHELTEFIGKHLFERSPYYDQAHFKINTDNKSKEEIVEEIIKVLI